MKGKNDKESSNAHELVTSSIRSENLTDGFTEKLEATNQMTLEKLEAKNQETSEKLEAKNQKMLKMSKECIEKLEAKNKEHIQQLEAKNAQLEAKNKEHHEEVDKLKEKQKEDAIDFLSRSNELVRLRRVCNVRAALEYVHGCISSKKGEDPLLYESVDKVLEKLSNDQRFKECLIKTCEKNQVNVEAVKKCIGGLYHTSSKGLHGYDKVVIFETDWVVNEIIALGLIFKYYGVPFEYRNANEQLVEFPYKLASR
ncbi:23434_t:CDS:2 [Gigaspora margarita]|uniref:23434_t:CDS:1 n=1 Tax=Gigaspora margarita TaxID=4874 RepID=A0ABN7VFN4_GIGMA|nr:23434_t:CDS:2 [Gigaspora margarita]